MVLFIRSLKSTLSFLAWYTDLGFNQPPISDRELSDFVDWDQLSSMADDNDVYSGPGPICPFNDREAEEEDLVDLPAFRKSRRRAFLSEGSDTDESVA